MVMQLKKHLILDVETTILNKGNPFSEPNQLCYIGFKTAGSNRTVCLNLLEHELNVAELQAIVDSHDFLVAFNAKFDCHWLERVGINLERIRIWDCQYGAFLFSNQRTKYPSLNGEAERLGLGSKLDVVATEYWEKGIDTIDIPPDIMVQYLEQDVNLTEQIFHIHKKLFETTERNKYRLFLLHMEDQVVLREMERNGILCDVEQAEKEAKNAAKQIDDIESKLREGYLDVPINFSSTDHLSAYLYGGSVAVDSRIPIGVYKTGAKTGQTRFKIVTHEYKLPRLVEPVPKSELKKDGLWSTDEKTLRQLRCSKEVKARVGLLDERAKQEKLRGTYYEGIPKKIREMVWSSNTIHSNLNQCVAVTGRLSSSSPNQQNFPPEFKRLCISRYG